MLSTRCRLSGPTMAPGGLVAVRVAWLPSPESDVRGYQVFRSRTEGSPMVPVGAAEGDEVFYDLDIEMPLAAPDRGDYSAYAYRYLVRAIDHSGNQGEPSDTLACTLIESPILKAPKGDIAERMPIFRWRVGYEHGFSYVLGVSDEGGEILWQYASEAFYFDPMDFEILFDADDTASISELKPGGSYYWWVEVKASGYAHRGSIEVTGIRVGG